MNKAATNVDKTADEVAPRHARQARVAELDRLLEREPGAIEARYERAGLLRELGAFQEAKRDYLELLRCKPDDFGVLNDFGTLALTAGYKDAAHLKKENDLNSLHNRDDFKKLVAELERPRAKP